MSHKTNPVAICVIGFLATLSGAAALSHELLWTRRFVDILGATDWVVGRVLGLFFLGISLGAYWSTIELGRDKNAARIDGWTLRRLAAVEFGIGLLSLPAAFVSWWTDWIWPWLGTDGVAAWSGAFLKLLIGVLAVMPPAVAMGFTLPLFILAATKRGKEVGTVGIWIYAVNTLGGVVGLWFTSTWLIQWYGASSSMLIVIALNVLIAILIWGYATLQRPIPKETKKAKREREKHQRDLADEAPLDEIKVPGEVGSGGWSQLAMLSFVSGFVVLAYEVLLLRLIYLVVPSSFYSTSALLANVILFLAFSSIIISLWDRFGKQSAYLRSPVFIAFCLMATSWFINTCPRVMFELTDQLMAVRYLEGLNGRQIESLGQYWTLVFWLVAGTGGLGLLGAGLVFPALIKQSSVAEPEGTRIGWLLCANGIGGLLGSEFSNMVLVGWVGIYASFTLLACLVLLCGVVVLFLSHRIEAIMLALFFGLLIFVAHSFNSGLPYISPRTVKKFVIQETVYGREGVLLVVKDEKESKSILVNGQYVLGSSGFMDDQRRQMALPWLLNPNAKKVCSLGLATGISASGLEALENPPAVTAVELSANVEQLARTHFSSETSGFFDRDANRIVVEDARIFMAASSNEFDLIVGDLYRPHGSGEGRLYTVEHFGNVKRALTNGGVFCQWVPAYQLNYENWKTIAASFQAVFPHALVVRGNRNNAFPVVGLVGRKSDRGWSAIELDSCFANVPNSLVEADPLLASARTMVLGELKERAYPAAKLNTLDNLAVELAAGKFWILKDLRQKRPQSFEKEFIRGPFMSEFLRRLRKETVPLWER